MSLGASAFDAGCLLLQAPRKFKYVAILFYAYFPTSPLFKSIIGIEPVPTTWGRMPFQRCMP
jgi:hypothetical protein